VSFTLWAADEPNNANSLEHCGVSYVGNAEADWYDLDCFKSHIAVVCEKVENLGMPVPFAVTDGNYCFIHCIEGSLFDKKNSP
jgi:hypothetical protein